jgi:hypothetical protein
MNAHHAPGEYEAGEAKADGEDERDDHHAASPSTHKDAAGRRRATRRRRGKPRASRALATMRGSVKSSDRVHSSHKVGMMDSPSILIIAARVASRAWRRAVKLGHRLTPQRWRARTSNPSCRRS